MTLLRNEHERIRIVEMLKLKKQKDFSWFFFWKKCRKNEKMPTWCSRSRCRRLSLTQTVSRTTGGVTQLPKVINFFETKFPFVYKCFKEGRDEMKFYVKHWSWSTKTFFSMFDLRISSIIGNLKLSFQTTFMSYVGTGLKVEKC